MNGLAGKNALVTGASRGLGKGIALALADKGVNIVVNYRQHQKAAEDTVGEILGKGRRAMAQCADVREWPQVRTMVTNIINEWGRIDFLINNVGDFIYKEFDKLDVKDWYAMLDSNLNSCFYCCKAVLPFMRKQNFGRIINIGLGNAGMHAFIHVLPYAIAKTGVHILSKSLALNEAAHGITVNVVAPGLMNNGSLDDEQVRQQSRMVPMNRPGTADDLAGAVLYLLSDAAGYVTGTEILVSGGWGL